MRQRWNSVAPWRVRHAPARPAPPSPRPPPRPARPPPVQNVEDAVRSVGRDSMTQGYGWVPESTWEVWPWPLPPEIWERTLGDSATSWTCGWLAPTLVSPSSSSGTGGTPSGPSSKWTESKFHKHSQGELVSQALSRRVSFTSTLKKSKFYTNTLEKSKFLRVLVKLTLLESACETYSPWECLWNLLSVHLLDGPEGVPPVPEDDEGETRVGASHPQVQDVAESPKVLSQISGGSGHGQTSHVDSGTHPYPRVMLSLPTDRTASSTFWTGGGRAGRGGGRGEGGAGRAGAWRTLHGATEFHRCRITPWLTAVTGTGARKYKQRKWTEPFRSSVLNWMPWVLLICHELDG